MFIIALKKTLLYYDFFLFFNVPRENVKMFLLCEFEQSLIETDVFQNIYTANRIKVFIGKWKTQLLSKFQILLSHNQHKYFEIIHIPHKVLNAMKYILVYSRMLENYALSIL